MHTSTVASDESSAGRLVSYFSRPMIANGKLTECDNGDVLFLWHQPMAEQIDSRFSVFNRQGQGARDVQHA